MLATAFVLRLLHFQEQTRLFVMSDRLGTAHQLGLKPQDALGLAAHLANGTSKAQLQQVSKEQRSLAAFVLLVLV